MILAVVSFGKLVLLTFHQLFVFFNVGKNVDGNQK